MEIATNQAVVISKPKARFELTARLVPTPGEDELLVRSRAIAINPVDWKIQDYGIFVTSWPSVLGSDVSGDVVAVGSGVTKFKPGDRVVGYAAVIYNSKADHGAFQEHVLLRELSTTLVPQALTYVDASVFPMAVATAGVALILDMGNPKTGYLADSDKKAILIWGAASSVGSTAVQIAHDLGMTVFATASEKHHAALRGLGADHVFEYRDADVVDQIARASQAAGVFIDQAFDTIGIAETASKTAEVVTAAGSQHGRKTVELVLPWPEDLLQPPDIDVRMVAAWRHATDEPQFGAWLFNDYLARKLADGSFKIAPKARVIEGGLGAIQKALDINKEGVSGEKLVIGL